jgi:hypothetical protein
MHHFCTYFNINYLPRACALHASLQVHCPSYHLHALCFDEESFERLSALNLPHVTPISLAEFEAAHPALTAVKRSRNKLEYFFTCGPNLPLYVFDQRPDVDAVTYVDSDLCFFSDPQPLFDAWEGHSIGVTAHHLPAFRRAPYIQRHTGFYNVGWLSFRRDRDGLGCLKWWRDRCLEWCYERFEDGKYADQLYLDQWPKLFPGFYEYVHCGANVAPWNVCDYRLSLRGGRVYCDDDPLIFYHFHALKQIAPHLFNTNLSLTLRPPHPVLKRHVYLPYIQQLQNFAERGCDPTSSNRHYRVRSPLAQWPRDALRVALGIVFRQYIYVKNGRIY